jgi:hypothetical protein
MTPTRTAAEDRIWSLIRQAGVHPEGRFGPDLKSPSGIWSREVEVPLQDLEQLRSSAPSSDIARRLSGQDRLRHAREKKHWKPLEIALAKSGGMKIIDGNHRIFVARERGDQTVVAQFFLVDKPYWAPAAARLGNPRRPPSRPDLSSLSREELERMDAADLDRAAFGYARGDLVTLPWEQIRIVHGADLADARYQQQQLLVKQPSGAFKPARSAKDWARAVLKNAPPVDVEYRDAHGVFPAGFVLYDGHHRWLAAKTLGVPLAAKVRQIDAKPIEAILAKRTRPVAALPAPRRRKNPLAPSDVSMLAQAYQDGPDASRTTQGRALGRAAAARVHRDFQRLRQKLRVEFTPDDPYVCTAEDGRSAFEQMVADIESNGRLRVFTGGTSSPLWDRETNAMARALHDYDHYRAGADFSMNGELRAYRAAADRDPELAPAYLSEIVLQAADYQLHGGVYAPQQKLVIPSPEVQQLVRRANPVIDYDKLAQRIANFRVVIETVRDKYDRFLPAIRDVENAATNLGMSVQQISWHNTVLRSHEEELKIYKEHAIRMLASPAVIFTLAVSPAGRGGTVWGITTPTIDISDAIYQVLQGYDLPPKLRKRVELAARYFAKRGPAKTKATRISDFYQKQMDVLTDIYKALSESMRTGVKHQEASEKSLAREVKAGPFKLINTGGFDALTMETVRLVVHSAAARMVAHKITSPLYGEISVTNTLASSKILAFYDPTTDHAFVRANLKKVEREAEQTVIHELIHRLDHITPAITKLLPQLYRDVQAADRKEREDKFEEAWKAHAPKPGDVYTPADASRTYEVTGVEYSGRGLKKMLSGVSGYVVKLEDRKSIPGAVQRAHVAAEGYLMNKGVFSPRTKSGFITGYATKNPAENFAEMVSFWCMGQLTKEQEALLLPVLLAGGLDVHSMPTKGD